MSSDEKMKGSFTQRVKHELIEFWMIALYLMFFFCALVTYTMLLLKKYEVSNDALNYGFAVVNALVIGKVILVGEMMRLGRGYEKRPLYQSVLLKSVVFAGLVLVFHILEETVKRVIHGEAVWDGLAPSAVGGHGLAGDCHLLRVRSAVCVQGDSPGAG